jgi:hypothetical protein
MKSFFRCRAMLCLVLVCSLALACSLISAAPLCSAQSPARIAGHASKIHKKLAKYPLGSYLEFKFRNHTDAFGNLDALSAASFTFTNADSNAKETRLYTAVSRVEKGKTYIGEGTAPRRHILFF